MNRGENMKQIGTSWDRNNRNTINDNFTEADRKVLEQKQRVDRLIQDAPQPSEVVDARGEHAVLGDRLNEFTAQLAQTEQEITDLQTNKADKSTAATKSELTNAVTPKADKTYVDTELTKKRAETASNPIMLSELHTEVKTAMTGGSVPVVGVDAVGTENLKSKSATREKLADNFNDNGNLASGTNIDTVFKDGACTVIAPITGTLPGDWISSQSAILEVKQISNRWTLQRLTNLFDASIQYVRRIDPNNSIIGNWEKVNIGVSHLAKKTLVCLGDSITEFGNYPETIAKRTGMKVYNCGFGGTRMAIHSGNYDKFSMSVLSEAIASGVWTEQDTANATLAFANYETLKNIDWNTIDYITIAYGTNDWAGTISTGSVPLGTSSDTTRDTLNGAIPIIIENILTAYPHIKIAFITPIWRSRISPGDGLESDANPNRNGEFLIDFADAIIERANANHVTALDNYRNSNINKFTELTYISDGVHPTQAGYDLLGNRISSFLLSNF
jgi:lysophospholipase L1-like esterase